MKQIPGFEGYFATEEGEIYSERKKLKQSNKGKYLKVMLVKGEKRYSMLVHRLVLLTFVGECPEGMETCHNDGNPANNSLENLRWDTRSGNFKDKLKHCTDDRGEKSVNHKLTDADVLEIRSKYVPRKYTTYTLAEEYGVSQSLISMVVRKKHRVHI